MFGELELEPEPPNPFVTNNVTRTVQCKLIPVINKISMEDEGIFKRFNKTVELIFDNIEEITLKDFKKIDDIEIPNEILIPKHYLAILSAETAKLKSLGAMESVSTYKLVKLLNILEHNIQDGSKVVPLPSGENNDASDKLHLEVTWDKVMGAADASLSVLNILTSRNMSKRVYIDEVIDQVALFLHFQMSNTIYPSYDSVYQEIAKSETGHVRSMKKKRSYAHGVVHDGHILGLYNKAHELTSMLADLVKMQLLPDTTILHFSTLGVAPFFVENIPALQLAALRLVTNLFSKYEKWRKLMLDDILASIARLPSSKRSLRSYLLNTTTCIQMLTALVLQLIQCVVILPNKLASKDKQKETNKKRQTEDVVELHAPEELDCDVLIDSKYTMAMGTAYQFLTIFLKKCGSKNEDIDYRPLFENFVQDLLTTVNAPEWPAAELLLSLLGRVLCDKFQDRNTEMALRISCLEYLGIITARLRKDVVQSKMKVDYIDSIIALVKEKEKERADYYERNVHSTKKKSKDEIADDAKEETVECLQHVLLDHLAVNGGDQAAMNARHFYICQWYRDINAYGRKPKKKSQKGHKNLSSDDEDETLNKEPSDEELSDSTKDKIYKIKEVQKNLLLQKIPPFGISEGNTMQVLSTHIDEDSAQLIVKYLSSKRPFFNFNSYLQGILKVLLDQSSQIRTKALKCMTMMVTEDPDVLLREDICKAVQYSFTDNSTMVREAAVDLVGKFVLHKQNLITQYYNTITERILDTGVSVRRRVIKILKDICIQHPGYEKIPEICVKMIRRINDEEGIRKMVIDVFQNLWFIPLRERNRSPEEDELLMEKAKNVTDAVFATGNNTEWFEQLLRMLLAPWKNDESGTKKDMECSAQLVLASQQIVDCLVESVLLSEETSIKNWNEQTYGVEKKTVGSFKSIAACFTTLYLFAKIRPQLLVNHVQILQPYLQIQCKTQEDHQIVSNVARILELAVPLIKYPSEFFLSQLEEDVVKLILQHDKKVVSACVSCLGSVVNSVTKNFDLIRDCFKKCYGYMSLFRKHHERNSKDPVLARRSNILLLRRSLFTVSLFFRHFDFENQEIYNGLASGADTVDEVFETTLYFMGHDATTIQTDTLNALGSICIRHCKFMLESKLKILYIDIIRMEESYSVDHKIMVLNNLETFLVEEETRMRKLDERWEEHASKENWKEMGDISSGMISTVIQVYLRDLLNSFIHPNVKARYAASRVISLILSQGLVHPIEIVPYLICMSTDSAAHISHTAARGLQDIEKKYPGFTQMKLLQGIKLSHKLQEIVQDGKVVRGCRVSKDSDIPTALNSFLYSIMNTTKAQRRAILTSLLKQFDDTAKSPLSLMLYLADNLAYIPFTVLDEPLFLIHHIDIMMSVAGFNLLQTFKEALRPPPCKEQPNLEARKDICDENLDDEFDSVYSRLPEDCGPLQEAITACQGCMLLLALKEHLKSFYGLTTVKIQQYSPNDSSKLFDRQAIKRRRCRFNPEATIAILEQGISPPDELNVNEKQDLVKNYLEFKDLMNRIDPDERDDTDGDTPTKNVMPGYQPHSNSRSKHSRSNGPI